VAALVGFKTLKVSFFPDSTRAQFMIDFWFPEGTRIEETADRISKAEDFLLKKNGVTAVSTSVGSGHTRFILVYSPEKSWDAYAQCLVDVEDYRKILR
jgi:multidrug efflux pump subunit AcrB